MRLNERLLHDIGISKADLATLRSAVDIAAGTGTLSLQDAVSVDIDGGAIDGTIIGGTNPAAGSFTVIVGTISTAAQPNITSLGTLTAIVITGGTIDGTVIGGTTAAAGSFTTIVGTLSTAAQPNITSLGTLAAIVVTGGTINGTVIGGITPAAATVTTLTLTGLLTRSTTAGITAFAGGGQASATALTTDINEVSTVATAADSVKLPSAAAGYSVTIINNGANACDVFPASGDNLGAGIDTAASLAAGAKITYDCYDTTNWA